MFSRGRSQVTLEIGQGFRLTNGLNLDVGCLDVGFSLTSDLGLKVGLGMYEVQPFLFLNPGIGIQALTWALVHSMDKL
jgi:hypothetical protein